VVNHLLIQLYFYQNFQLVYLQKKLFKITICKKIIIIQYFY
jgi:hypothetical protein